MGGENLYSLVDNNPCNSFDLLGLCGPFCKEGLVLPIRSELKGVPNGRSPEQQKWQELVDEVIDEIPGSGPVKRAIDWTEKALLGFAELTASTGNIFQYHLKASAACCVRGDKVPENLVHELQVTSEEGEGDYSVRLQGMGVSNLKQDLKRKRQEAENQLKEECTRKVNAAKAKR